MKLRYSTSIAEDSLLFRAEDMPDHVPRQGERMRGHVFDGSIFSRKLTLISRDFRNLTSCKTKNCSLHLTLSDFLGFGVKSKCRIDETLTIPFNFFRTGPPTTANLPANSEHLLIT
jgi:hypothetical protein